MVRIHSEATGGKVNEIQKVADGISAIGIFLFEEILRVLVGEVLNGVRRLLFSSGVFGVEFFVRFLFLAHDRYFPKPGVLGAGAT
jgi:hypothetical protein